MTFTEGSGAPYKHPKLPFTAPRDVILFRAAIHVRGNLFFHVQPYRSGVGLLRANLSNQPVALLLKSLNNLGIYSITTMLPRPSVLRAAQLASRQIRSPVLRNTVQRRFASHEPTKLVGPMDNAFNRERLAVKQHAKQSTGTSSSWKRGVVLFSANLWLQNFGGDFASSTAVLTAALKTLLAYGPQRRHSSSHPRITQRQESMG